VQIGARDLLLTDILLLLLLLLLSGFFSGSETALFSLSPIKVARLKTVRGKRGALVAELVDNPRRLLISIILGNMFVNVFSSALAESAATKMFGEKGLSISILAMTFLILVFGEITPKTIAIHNAEQVSPMVAPIIDGFGKLVFPFRRAVRFVADLILSVLTRRMRSPETAVSGPELRTAVEIGHREGILEDREKEMIHSVIELGEKWVADVMRPRSQIVGFDIRTPMEQICAAVRSTRYSRIPLYRGNLDRIEGILYVKDLLAASSRPKGEVDLSSLLRAPLYVPEQKRAGVLLRDLRRRRVHLALVVDEYGLVSGLVTLEDLLEEIFGQILDKEPTTTPFQWIDTRAVRVDARMELDALNEVFGTSLSGRVSAHSPWTHSLGGRCAPLRQPVLHRIARGAEPDPGSHREKGPLRRHGERSDRHRDHSALPVDPVLLRGGGDGDDLVQPHPDPAPRGIRRTAGPDGRCVP